MDLFHQSNIPTFFICCLGLSSKSRKHIQPCVQLSRLIIFQSQGYMYTLITNSLDWAFFQIPLSESSWWHGERSFTLSLRHNLFPFICCCSLPHCSVRENIHLPIEHSKVGQSRENLRKKYFILSCIPLFLLIISGSSYLRNVQKAFYITLLSL